MPRSSTHLFRRQIQTKLVYLWLSPDVTVCRKIKVNINKEAIHYIQWACDREKNERLIHLVDGISLQLSCSPRSFAFVKILCMKYSQISDYICWTICWSWSNWQKKTKYIDDHLHLKRVIRCEHIFMLIVRLCYISKWCVALTKKWEETRKKDKRHEHVENNNNIICVWHVMRFI